MGYYTNYRLNPPADEKLQIRQNLRDISGYPRWHFEDDDVCLNEAKWYSHKDDMLELSTRFPHIKFELECHGGDGEKWMVCAYQGKVEQLEGTVVYSPRTLW